MRTTPRTSRRPARRVAGPVVALATVAALVTGVVVVPAGSGRPASGADDTAAGAPTASRTTPSAPGAVSADLAALASAGDADAAAASGPLDLERLPLRFIRNVGQAADDVAVTSVTVGAAPIEASTTGVELPLVGGGAVSLRFVGGRTVAPTVAGDTGGTVAWAGRTETTRRVPMGDQVRWDDLWQGVDAVITGPDGRPKSEYVVAPGADPGVVRLAYEGAAVSILDDGSLQITTDDGTIVDQAPYVYQDTLDGRAVIASNYRVDVVDGTPVVGIEVGRYDTSLALVIDPVTVGVSTFVGGTGDDEVAAVAASLGGVVLVGSTTSTELTGLGLGVTTTRTGADRDAFVLTIADDLAGGFQPRSLLFYGGTGDDAATAVDAFENLVPGPADNQRILVGGTTTSTTLAGMTGPQVSAGGGTDGFVLDVDPGWTTGTIDVVGATYVGGPGDDRIDDVTVAPLDDPTSRSLAVLGTTSSTTGLPTTPGAVQAGYGGGASDAFVIRYATGLAAVSAATYLGGGGDETGAGVANGADVFGVDTAVAITTTSDTMPTPDNTFQRTALGGSDGFLALLATDLSVVNAAYVGGPGDDVLTDVSYEFRVPVVAGSTTSASFESQGGAASSVSTTVGGPGGGVDGFWASFFAFEPGLDPSWFGYYDGRRIGGSGDDVVRAFGSRDPFTDPVVFGTTTSTDLAVDGAAVGLDGSARSGPSDGFAARADAAGSFVRYVGGAGDDGIVDAAPFGSTTVVVGSTTSAALPGGAARDVARTDRDGFAATIRVQVSESSLTSTAVDLSPGTLTVPVGALAASSPPAVVDRTAAAPLRTIDVGDSIQSIPLRTIPLRTIPLRTIPLRTIMLSSVPLRTIGGWDAVLAGTPLADLPLSTVSLQRVFDVVPPARLLSITLGDLDLSGSPLASISLASVAFGTVPLSAIPVPNSAGAGNTTLDVLLTNAGFTVRPTDTVLAADIAGAPLRTIPLRTIPLRTIDLAATGIGAVPLRTIPLRTIPLRTIPLRTIPLVGTKVDCTVVDCGSSSTLTLEDAFDANAILPATTLADLARTSPAGVTPATYDLSLFGATTVGDVLVALVDPAGLAWQEAAVGETTLVSAARSAGTASTTEFVLTGTLRDRSAGSPLRVFVNSDSSAPVSFLSATAQVGGTTVALQPDSTLVGRSSWTSTAPVTYDGTTTPVPVSIRVVASAGLTLGPRSLAAEVRTSADLLSWSTATVPVVDPLTTSTPTAPAPLATDVLRLGWLGTVGQVDHYALPVTVGSTVSIDLGPLPADYDLRVYAPTTPAPGLDPLRPADAGQPAVAALEPADPTLIDGVQVEQPGVGADVPVAAGRAILATSAARGRAPEQITFTATRTGTVLVQVSGHNGAVSTSPYQLRARVTAPPSTAACPARSVPFAGQGTAGALPAVPAGTTTLVLVNQRRLGDTYGATAAASVLTSLRSYASAAGVNGVVVPVDGDASVAAAYTAWDAAPCDPDRANQVVAAINALVDRLVPAAQRASLRSIVLAGADDQLPFARIPDLTTLSNEVEHAAETLDAAGAPTPTSAAFAAARLLTDDPYGDFAPRAWGSTWLYVPDVALGRLVETPTEIVAQVDAYLAAAGRLDPTTAVTTGYDFLTDGARAVDAAIGTSRPGIARSLLVGEAWTRADLIGRIATGTTPGIAAVNAHFDQYRLLPADGNATATAADLASTADLPPPTENRLAGRIWFSMGCHGGLSVPDTVRGASDAAALDWAQALARQRAVFVGNTGYGYGDSATVAYSERLMTLFAQRLDGTMSAGQALAFAKQEYLGTLLAGQASEYDRKAAMVATFYGIPTFAVGAAATPPAPPTPPTTAADPSAGGLLAADLVITPSFTTVPAPDGSRFLTADGRSPLVADGRPIQPRTDRSVGVPGAVARGVLVTSLASSDTAITVTVSRPVIERSTVEPALGMSGAAFPSTLASVSTIATPNGTDQRVQLAAGQFFGDADPTTPAGQGVQRRFTSIGARVYYSSSTDVVPPSITTATASVSAGTATFAVNAGDPSGVVRITALVLDGSGTWRSFDLPGGAGSIPVTGTEIEYLVQAVDGAGNVGTATGKGALLRGTGISVETGGGTVAPALDAGPDLATIPGGSVSVTGTVTALGAGPVTVTVDDGLGGPATAVGVVDGTFQRRLTFPAAGRAVVGVRACQSGACSTAQVVVTVAAAPPPPAPVVDAGPDLRGVTGVAVSSTASVVGAGSATVSTGVGSPTTAAVVAGGLSFAATYTTAGTYTVSVEACSAGGCTTDTAQVVVTSPTPPPPPPVDLPAPVAAAVAGVGAVSVGWLPLGRTTPTVTGWRVVLRVGTTVVAERTLGATTLAATFGGLTNGVRLSIEVQALSSGRAGQARTLSATPFAAPTWLPRLGLLASCQGPAGTSSWVVVNPNLVPVSFRATVTPGGERTSTVVGPLSSVTLTFARPAVRPTLTVDVGGVVQDERRACT